MRLRWCSLGKDRTEGSPCVGQEHIILMCVTGGVNLGRLAEVVFVRIHHHKFTIFLLPLLNIWREILWIYATILLLLELLPPDIRILSASRFQQWLLWWSNGDFLLPSFLLHVLIGILWRRLVNYPSCIYLEQCGFIDTYLILWVLIIPSFILWLNWFQLWPLQALSGGSYAPLYAPILFFSSSLLSGITRDSRFILYYFLPQPQN